MGVNIFQVNNRCPDILDGYPPVMIPVCFGIKHLFAHCSSLNGNIKNKAMDDI